MVCTLRFVPLPSVKGGGRSKPVPVPPSGAHGLGERWTVTLEPLDSRAAEEQDQGENTDSAAAAGKPKAVFPGKPTFLQKERWKAIQKARRKGMSLRAIERRLGNPQRHREEIPRL